MKQRILLFGAMLLTLAACTNDPDMTPGSDSNVPAASTDTQLKLVNADPSRLLTYQPKVGVAKLATRATADVLPNYPKPEYPSMITKDVSGLSEWVDTSVDWDHKYITSGECKVGSYSRSYGEVNTTDDGLTLHVAGNLDFGSFNGVGVTIYIHENSSAKLGYIGCPATIYVGKNASLEMTNGISNDITVIAWGSCPSVNLAGGKFIYCGEETLSVNLSDNQTSQFISYGPVKFENYSANSNSEFVFYGDAEFATLGTSNDNVPQFYFGGQTKIGKLDLNRGEFVFGGPAAFGAINVASGKYPTLKFYGSVDVSAANAAENQWADGTVDLRGGTYVFENGEEKVHFEKLVVENQPSHITFNGCTTIDKLEVHANEAHEIEVGYYLYLGEVFAEHQSNCLFTLKDAILAIDGEANGAEAGTNVFPQYMQVKGVGTDGQTSGVYILKSLNLEVCSFNSESKAEFKNFSGDLTIFGADQESDPVINVWCANFGDNVHHTLDDERVSFPTEYIRKADAYLKGDITSCRGSYLYGNDDTEGTWITPPYGAHKYSATGIDFAADGTTVYVCWHSNLAAQKNPDGHEHGTNVGDDGSQPSVDNDEDWGGIIDVLTIPAGAPEQAVFAGASLEQDTYKYNHVKFYDNTLYLASTRKAGAALHVVPLENNGTFLTPDPENPDLFPRFRLTGASANSTAVVEGELVTISGRSEGGINWFAPDADEDQRRTQLNDNTTDFGGKFVYNDGSKLIALHNTDNATVSIYGFDKQLESSFSIGTALEPNDGKNVCIADGTRIFICCGRNGLEVYNYSGDQRLGGSKKTANGCALDEDDPDHRYIYIATGDGLAVLDTQTADELGNYKTVKSVHFNGNYFEGRTGNAVTDSAEAKASSNYVRVKNGVAYVAYGMYGLRMYKVADLLAAKK